MDNQNMPQGAPDQGGQEGDPSQKIVGVMTGISSALGQLVQGFGDGKVVPPEAVKALSMAQKNYDAFLSIAMKSMGVEGAPDVENPTEDMAEPPQSDMSQGKRAIPAGGPTRRGAIPAR